MIADGTTTKSAVVLLSGGLDSATTLAIARSRGYVCHVLSFDYGQRHHLELTAARRVAKHLNVASYKCVKIDTSFANLTDSALTGDVPVPKDRSLAEMIGDRSCDDNARQIPITYVPARNTLFLSYAVAAAEVLGSCDIFIGITAVDYSGYPDCRPQYIEAFERMANLATKAAVEGRRLTIHAPVIKLTKIQIIQKGLELGVDYGLTHSCYDPNDLGRPCTRCDSCLLRQHAFGKLGMTDPVLIPH